MTKVNHLLKPFGFGLLATIIMAFIMLRITINFQFILIIGVIVFFLTGVLCGKGRINAIISALLINLSFAVLFQVFVLIQLPGLFYFILIFFVSSLLGLTYNRHRKQGIYLTTILFAMAIFIALKVIPVQLQHNLSQETKEALPKFEIVDLKGNVINNSHFQDKVVVISFFGTWCAPCRKELPELLKAKKAFESREDVLFFVINADINDSIEKFETYIAKNSFTFDYVYDFNGKFYKSLDLEKKGIPILLVIDKQQNIRMKHIGFNEGETNFSKHIIELITKYL